MIVTMQTYPSAWNQPDAPWNLKAARARDHIEVVRKLVAEYEGRQPWNVRPDDHRDADGWLAYRLFYNESVPPTIQVVAGDAISNLRAALESIAFELARISQPDRRLKNGQLREPTFPIYSDPVIFDRDFRKPKLLALYAAEARQVLRRIQPFAMLEQVKGESNEFDSVTYTEHARSDVLVRLDHAWNVDKHRHVVGLRWIPDSIDWRAKGATQRRTRPGDGTLENGSILIWISGEDPGMGDDVSCDFDLCMADDPGFLAAGGNDSLVQALDRWHHFVANAVLPAIFDAVPHPGA
jgi:hypothetical protein